MTKLLLASPFKDSNVVLDCFWEGSCEHVSLTTVQTCTHHTTDLLLINSELWTELLLTASRGRGSWKRYWLSVNAVHIDACIIQSIDLFSVYYITELYLLFMKCLDHYWGHVKLI